MLVALSSVQEMLKTSAGKKMGENRHLVMSQFLDEFYNECEGSVWLQLWARPCKCVWVRAKIRIPTAL